MKRVIIGTAVLAALLSANLRLGRGQVPTSAPGTAATAIPPSNPLQVALLKWYPANRTTTFPGMSIPEGLAFDGASMWVANAGNNTLTKLRVSDGAILGTFSLPGSPIGVAFDGANIWAVIESQNSVTKVRASDGTVLGTFSVGSFPIGIAFDGANVWVANAGSNSVSKR